MHYHNHVVVSNFNSHNLSVFENFRIIEHRITKKTIHDENFQNVSAPPTQVVQPSFSTGINVHDKETDVQNTMGNLSIVDEANTSLEECKPRSSNGGQQIALHCPVTVVSNLGLTFFKWVKITSCIIFS